MANLSLSRGGRVVAVALALLPVMLATGVEQVLATHSSSTIGLLALDADPQGNGATSLGPIDGCARVEAGSTLNVDYIADSIPQDRPIIAIEAQIRYDPQLLEIVAADYELLLAAVGAYSPFAGLSDNLPDTDGNFRISVLDTASSAEPEANVETGAGVLARITFHAKSSGVSNVAIAVQPEPLLYPLLLDTQNEMILADRLGSASVAVDQDCPVQAVQPKIDDLAPVNEEILAANPQLRAGVPAAGTSVPASSPTSENAAPSQAVAATPLTDVPAPSNKDEGDGSDTGLTAAALVLLTVIAAGAGGWFLYRRFRNRPQAS